jgi:hypothetical protein
MAWRYVTEREDTLVAQALATSSRREGRLAFLFRVMTGGTRRKLTSTVVIGFHQGKKGAYGKDVGVVGEHHLGEMDKLCQATCLGLVDIRPLFEP